MQKLTLEQYTLSEAPFLSKVKRWIEECTHDHDMCKLDRHLQSTLRNLKVIDCHTREVVEAQPGYIYVALSYVWGTNAHSPNLKDKLPQTIEDSLQVVLLLGYRYLWVDRYVRTPACCKTCPDSHSALRRTKTTNITRYNRWVRYTPAHI